MTHEELYIEIAATYINSPYIWGGKGDLIFNDKKLVLEKNPFGPKHPLVFDCSGFVLYSLMKLTQMAKLDLPTMTGSHSAKTILDTFPLAKSNEAGTLLLYPQHVAIDMGRGFILDAAGGDSTTRTPQEAQAKGARVQLHFNRRNPQSLIGTRRIPLDKSELRSI